MQDRTRTISELLSYRLSQVSNSLTRSAGARYRSDFDVSVGEWRVLALLGQDGEITLNRLARRSALDKAQMSRVVTSLQQRGLVTKNAGARRSSVLTLSDAGRDVYEGLITAANERDRLLRSAVSPGNLMVFEEVLEQLARVARQFEQSE